MAVVALNAGADVTGFAKLQVSLTDGTSQIINLSKKPKVVISDGKLKITSEAATIEIDRDKVAQFTFLEPVSGVGKLTTPQSQFTVNGSSLLFADLKEGSVVEVYDINLLT